MYYWFAVYLRWWSGYWELWIICHLKISARSVWLHRWTTKKNMTIWCLDEPSATTWSPRFVQTKIKGNERNFIIELSVQSLLFGSQQGYCESMQSNFLFYHTKTSCGVAQCSTLKHAGSSCSMGGQCYPPDKSLKKNHWIVWFVLSTLIHWIVLSTFRTTGTWHFARPTGK